MAPLARIAFDEFHVIAETGEDALVYSRESDYAANMEAAIALPPVQDVPPRHIPCKKSRPPDKKPAKTLRHS